MTELQIEYLLDIHPNIWGFLSLALAFFGTTTVFQVVRVVEDGGSKALAILFGVLSVFTLISLVLFPSETVMREILEAL